VKSENYITVRLLSDNWSDIRIARLEFTFIAGDQATTPKSLFDMFEIVNNNIVWDIETCTVKFDFDDFKVTFVDMWSTFWPEINNENRLFIQSDYLFKYWRT